MSERPHGADRCHTPQCREGGGKRDELRLTDTDDGQRRVAQGCLEGARVAGWGARGAAMPGLRCAVARPRCSGRRRRWCGRDKKKEEKEEERKKKVKRQQAQIIEEVLLGPRAHSGALEDEEEEEKEEPTSSYLFSAFAAALEATPVFACVFADFWNDFFCSVTSSAVYVSSGAGLPAHCVWATGFFSTAPTPCCILLSSWSYGLHLFGHV